MLHFDEIMSVLYYTNMLNWIFIMLVHWTNSLRVDMSFHLYTLSRFEPTTLTVFTPLRYSFCLPWSWLEPTIYHTQDKHANHYITEAIIQCIKHRCYWPMGNTNLYL